MRFVAFDYQNTGIADQTEEEPLIKAEIWLALSQWQWGGSSKSWSCACSSSILCVSNLVSWFWLDRIPGFTYIYHVQTPWLMPGVLQRASEGAGLGFIRAAWFLNRIHGKDAGSVLLRIFATFSNMTKAYLFASHVFLFVILKPSDVPTYTCTICNLCQFTSSCISPSVVLSQLLAIGLCQWHHQRCQDLGRQSLKCWYNLVHVSTWWRDL